MRCLIVSITDLCPLSYFVIWSIYTPVSTLSLVIPLFTVLDYVRSSNGHLCRVAIDQGCLSAASSLSSSAQYCDTARRLMFFFIMLFQDILIFTFLNNTYYIHLLYILRERERERERERRGDSYNTFRFSLLCIYSTISFVWVTYLVWCKSTSVL